jgi:hypothetical protein
LCSAAKAKLLSGRATEDCACRAEGEAYTLCGSFFAQPSLKRPLCPQEWLSLRVQSNNAELFCFAAACAGRMLAASAAVHACFALIPIGTGAIPIGIVSMSIGIRAKSIGIGAFPVGTGAI